MKIELTSLYKQTLKKNNITQSQLPFIDFVKQLYINLRKQNKIEGVEEVKKVLQDSISMYLRGVSSFKQDQLENLKEFLTIEKEMLEKKIEGVENLIKNANCKQELYKNPEK